MRVVVIGTFPAATKERIVGSFPADWTVFAGTAAEAEGQLRDADVVIPEHIRVDDAFLGRAPRLAMVQTGAGYDNVDIAACTKRGRADPPHRRRLPGCVRAGAAAAGQPAAGSAQRIADAPYGGAAGRSEILRRAVSLLFVDNIRRLLAGQVPEHALNDVPVRGRSG